MKNRKLRSSKAGTSKRKVPSDVSPSTSLPPLVDGQLRCFLRVTVSRVLWTIHKPPPATFVRLRWWGESSSGTYFCPRDGSQTSQKTVKTTARFPIRCGPKQFTSYLTDMGSLVLEVMTKLDHLPIARAQVAGISRLTLSHPISGFYTLVSPTSEKLGELQVSICLEALTEAYDSSSSVPTTDISTEAPQVTTLMVPSQSRPISVNSGRESAGSSNTNTPRGKDYLYFPNAQKDKRKEESLENQMLTIDRFPQRQTAVNPRQEARNDDILSVILERGSKLRNAMVVSALKCDVDSDLALKDTPLPLPKDNILPSSSKSVFQFNNVTPEGGLYIGYHHRLFFPSCGKLLQEILHADSSLHHAPSAAVPANYFHPHCATDTENRAVDLLLGSLNGSLPLWDGDGSPPESLSGRSSVCGDSELNDPQYDQSLLENLFYKNPMSGDIEVENERGMTCSKSQTKKSTAGGAEDQLKHSGPQKVGFPYTDHEQTTEAGDKLPRLSVDQLTALGGTRLARVVIHTLSVPADSTATTPRKISGKEKPPRPFLKKKCFYFVEYAFPVASNSNRHDHSQVMAEEVTRIVSSKVTRGVVMFQQHCVFPVHLSGATIEQWWGTDLTFKIYSRKSTQKKPVPIGKAVYPLRQLLQRGQLSQSIVLPVQRMDGTSESQDIGPLKVSLELAADNKDFSSAKSKLGESARTPSHTIASPQRGPSPKPQHVDTGREDLSIGPAPDSTLAVVTVQRASQGPSPLPSLHSSHRPCQQAEEDYDVLLHALLMVPDGKDFNCGPMQPPNFYLNCKLFGSDETARSVMSWGQTNPSFSFVQVTPVALATKLLERMKNNVMVIEVWQRPASSGQDQLLGLVKLPLHQLYMSFRDPKITHLLLQAQYPVLGVDCYMPVIDVFSGSCKGNLRVLLAMGQSGQIVALQRMRNEESGSVSHLPRPTHLLDHQPYSGKKVNTTHAEAMREHVFVVRVEKVKGLAPLQSTVWGEADCYVQYTFPSQEGGPAQNLDSNLIESSVNLKPFRTTTTLCVPDPVFGHSETHVLLAPEGVPVQRLLLSALSSQGLASGGGIQFEVWCRYYYPNVRDQLVARGMLPLSKLCAMVTMQRQQPTEAQIFSLPLVPRTDTPSGQQHLPSGLLDVCVHYKHQPLRLGGQSGGVLASRIVTLVVQVHRASGLQAATRALAEKDETFQYYADVGTNTYVTAQLSFLPASEKRSTRVAPRTFCPEFDHHTEFPCELLEQRSSGETYSLAEQLQEASAVFTVWNRDSRKVMDTPKSKDTLLGTVKIPLANLIQKRTGISGWFGLYQSQDLGSSHDHHILVGGLEISINFAHHADRERVIKAAQGLGWEVGHREDEKQQDDEETWEDDVRTVSLTVSMPRVWLPVHCLLLPGHSELQRSTYCYFRYKLYDQEAFCSQVKHPSVEEGGEEGLATVAFQGARTVDLRSSPPLLWYLREERLEVQLWVAFRKERTHRPHDTDRLVGSAFVDLSSLAKRPRHKLTLSGVYPLFRRSAPDLSGAALRVHITLTSGSLPEELTPGADDQEDPDSLGELSSGEEAVEEVGPPPTVASRQSRTQSRRQTKSSGSTEVASENTASQHTDDSFAVTVTVDRAMHLSLTGCPLAERSGGMPSCCVSYMTADSSEPVSTAVIANTDCPVWDHHQECRLSKQLLLDPQQSLVFKVWHKGDIERVIGFASVDLYPLLSGFQSVCGWYNITDFSGQCQGQLKVSISPLRGVQELRGQRQAVKQEASKNSMALFQDLPINYHTTASYTSFPSHISRYTEQKISSPDQTDRLFSERSSENDRHDEHMESVRLYHQRLQEGGAAHHASSSSTAADIHPSSSALFSALRKNMSELDDIQRYFSHKLSTPTFPSMSEQGCHSRQEERRDSETHTCQLLLKSSRLVGEVNSIISGLQGHSLETIASNPQSSSTTPPSADDHPLPARANAFPESIPCSHKSAVSPLESVSPVPSPLQRMSEDHIDSRSEEEQDGHHNKAAVSEDEEEGRTGRGEEEGADADADADDDDDDDEDYEETVVEPRPLNEVTSLTDKTSPWTSILSDPDLGSQESLEAPEEQLARNSPDPTQEGEEGQRQTGLQTDNPQPGSPCEEYTCTRVEESERFDSDHSDGSVGDISDTEGDGDGTLRELEEVQREDPNITDRVSGDRAVRSESQSPSLSPSPPHTMSTYDTSCPLRNEDAQPQESPPLEIPNFFLPSHHLEASMRVLRLAPAFPKSASDPGPSCVMPGVPYWRTPRPRPNIPDTSMKKEETQRIAKIFASHFNEEH